MTDRRMISTNLFECSIAWRLGSEHPDLLGIAAQRVFQMLILLADDFGRGRYIPALIRVRAFSTTKDALADITDKQIEDWIKIMEDEGAVELYQVGDQWYYSLTGWEHYQRGNWRPKKSNIPGPGQLLLDTKCNKSDVSKGESKEVLGVMKGREEKGKEKKRSKETDKPSKNDGDPPSDKKRKYKSIEDQNPKTDGGKLIKFWHTEYRAIHNRGYSGDIGRMQGQIKILLRKVSYKDIGAGMTYLLHQDTTEFLFHTFDHFIRKANEYIDLAEKGRYEI